MASTPTPAARKGEAAKSGGVALPAASNHDKQSDARDAGATKPGWSGPKPEAGSSTTPFGGDKPSPINFLNRGSVDDQMPTIVSSTAPAKSDKARGKMAALPPKPIGSRDGMPTSSADESVMFTTEQGVVEGHYISISSIHRDTFVVGTQSLFGEMGWSGKVLAQKAIGVNNSTFITVFMCFDSLDDAKAAEDEVAMVNQDWKVKFVNQGDFAAAGDEYGTQTQTSYHDGQLLCVAVYNGSLADIQPNIVAPAVMTMCTHFGEVVAFREASQASSSELIFRVEFKKITAAREALSECTRVNAYEFHDWRVTTRKISEPVSSIQGLTGSMAAIGVTPHKAPDGTLTSPTGRTAWGVDENGKMTVAAPLVKVPKVSNPTDPVGGNVMSPARERYSTALVPMQSHPPYFGNFENAMVVRSASHPEPPHPRRSIPEDNSNEPQQVKLDRIRNGIDVRTTIMLRNLPNAWNLHDLKQVLDSISAGKYDFSYLRIDFEYSTNVGYAFVNFTDPEAIIDFVNAYIGREWQQGYHPRKIAQVSYATIQGIDCLIEKFRNSAIMSEFPDYCPKLWFVPADVAAGLCGSDDIGAERPFPAPNNASKKQRSLDNAGTVGLYAPRSGRGTASRRSNYDRGTTHQLQEDAAYQQGPMSPANGNYVFDRAPGPQYLPMMQYGYAPFAGAYYPMQEGAESGFPHYHHGFAVPHPNFGQYAMVGGVPASRLRTISRGRLGGVPRNVTVSERGYSGYTPRSLAAAAAGPPGEYFEAGGSGENVSPGATDAARVGNERN